jgi:hypothetical protein
MQQKNPGHDSCVLINGASLMKGRTRLQCSSLFLIKGNPG